MNELKWIFFQATLGRREGEVPEEQIENCQTG
jgi:hypothetical protein